jgi:hypothetical protein
MMARLMNIGLFHVSRLGRVGALGAALIAGALAADALVLRPMEARLDALIAANQRALLVPAAERRQRLSAGAAARTALEPEAAAVLRRLFDSADEAGIELARGDYRLVQEQDAGYRRYQLTLPVYGSYPAIRAFLAGVLADEPALALNSLLLRRDAIESADLEATLRFTLFLEAGT